MSGYTEEFGGRLYTGHFGRARKIPPEYQLAHCLKPPHYWAGPNAKEFAPSGKSFNDPNWQEAYLELISDRYPTEKALAAAIRPHLETREKVVFLCFERNPDACHRRLFALYIELMLGVAVPEFPVEMEIHTEPDPEEAGGEPKPGSLFDI
jgi:hypothetical protein